MVTTQPDVIDAGLVTVRLQWMVQLFASRLKHFRISPPSPSTHLPILQIPKLPTCLKQSFPRHNSPRVREVSGFGFALLSYAGGTEPSQL